jgi:integrase/recombinase XerD
MDHFFKGDCIMGKLRDQMQADLQLRGITPRTQATYLREVRNLALYFKKSPEELGEKEIKEYLLYLINDKKLPEGTYRNYYSGLKFLYKHTLKREWVMEKILCPKRRQKLPLVLDLSEGEALFSATKNLKHQAILMITYSSGLRVSEAARLKVTDIDSKRMMVRIQNGKKGKDRYSILSQTALECLRQYWIQYRPKEWLFEGQKKDRPLSTSSIRYIFYGAKKRAGIRKPASVHTLRHSFATHLIEAGTSLHHVQLLLGHRSPTTTTVYLHVSRHNLAQVTSPLDGQLIKNQSLPKAESQVNLPI